MILFQQIRLNFGCIIAFNTKHVVFINLITNQLVSKQLLLKSLAEILTTNCIKELEYPPFVVNPITVSVQCSNKERRVLDLRTNI